MGGSAVDIPIADTSSLGFKNIQEFADYILNQISNQQTSISNIINGTTTVGNAANLNGSNNYLIHGDPGTMQSLELYFSTPFIDFHFDNSTGDYTSRIIETSEHVISIEASDGISFFGPLYQHNEQGRIVGVGTVDSNALMLWAY